VVCGGAAQRPNAAVDLLSQTAGRARPPVHVEDGGPAEEGFNLRTDGPAMLRAACERPCNTQPARRPGGTPSTTAPHSTPAIPRVRAAARKLLLHVGSEFLERTKLRAPLSVSPTAAAAKAARRGGRRLPRTETGRRPICQGCQAPGSSFSRRLAACALTKGEWSARRGSSCSSSPAFRCDRDPPLGGLGTRVPTGRPRPRYYPLTRAPIIKMLSGT
jgi:hypothetical protein